CSRYGRRNSAIHMSSWSSRVDRPTLRHSSRTGATRRH
ncbi:MAG: hypothetical protein AVDCRST_MAG87-2837, partial [uncultured Thermomicrobiales bacterium]